MNQMPVKATNFQPQNYMPSNFSMIPTMEEMNHLITISRYLADTPFYGKLGPGGVLAIWLTARELRLPPMMCLNGGLHNIEGKVQMSSQLMNMMIINAGHEVNVVYSTRTGCKLEFVRNFKNGKKKIDYFEYNLEDAKEAQVFGVKHANGTWDPKPKANWIKFPRAMYFSRAMSGGGKMYLPDVLMNIYAMGEIYDVDEKDIINESSYVESEIPSKESQIREDAKSQAPIKADEPPKSAQPEKKKPTESELQAFKDEFKIGEGSKHENYLNAIAERCKKDKNEMVIMASMNRDGFVEAFAKWENEIAKKAEIAGDSKPADDLVAV